MSSRLTFVFSLIPRVAFLSHFNIVVVMRKKWLMRSRRGRMMGRMMLLSPLQVRIEDYDDDNDVNPVTRVKSIKIRIVNLNDHHFINP